MANSDLVQSVLRSLELLEAVARADDGLSLHDVAQLLGVQPSTAHNLARTLIAKRYLVKSANPARYRLGTALFEVVEQHRNREILQRAEHVMVRVSRTLHGATLTVTEAIGHDVMTVLRMSPEQPGFVQHRNGLAMNPYISAASLVFQAYWTASERDGYRQRYPFDEYGMHFWRTEKALDRFLADVREAGVVVIPTAGQTLHRIAAPILDTYGNLAATFGASLPVRAEENATEVSSQLVAAVLEAAKTISLFREVH
ncbi:MAG TPA: helix-turn-helix domain-containing protein [Armatimonadota bacterium]|nr:helix-turn-helix domain-containing protein [Armatimonadota bacterium]